MDTCITCGNVTDDGLYEAGSYYCGPCFDYAAGTAVDDAIAAREPTFRQMTVEHLGSDASPQDLALFQSACLILMETEGLSEAEATDVLWGNGDWYGRACTTVGAPRF